jgi:hypothetical protein
LLFLREDLFVDYNNKKYSFLKFSRTIDKVQENTEFYWRYQRYSFVRGYFERPPLAYPPLIIFTHIFFIVLALQQKCCPRLCRKQIGDENRQPKSTTMTSIFSKIEKNFNCSLNK